MRSLPIPALRQLVLAMGESKPVERTEFTLQISPCDDMMFYTACLKEPEFPEGGRYAAIPHSLLRKRKR